MAKGGIWGARMELKSLRKSNKKMIDFWIASEGLLSAQGTPSDPRSARPGSTGKGKGRGKNPPLRIERRD